MDNENIPFILVGNKCDVPEERKVSIKEAEQRAQSWGCPYIETSAKTRKNVEEIFEKLMRLIRDKKASEAPKDGKIEKEKACCTIV